MTWKNAQNVHDGTVRNFSGFPNRELTLTYDPISRDIILYFPRLLS